MRQSTLLAGASGRQPPARREARLAAAHRPLRPEPAHPSRRHARGGRGVCVGRKTTAVSALVRALERVAARPLARPSRSTIDDAARRGAHVARHSEARPVARPGRRLQPRPARRSHRGRPHAARPSCDSSLVDWTVSGHSWVFGRPRDPVAIVNERTWKSFGPRMARRFRRLYGSYLRSFRGFVATYPPCFALLYEGLDKPTLAIAATRYEWPFTHYGRALGLARRASTSGRRERLADTRREQPGRRGLPRAATPVSKPRTSRAHARTPG